MQLFPKTAPPPQPEPLPADLVRLGFRLVVRQQTQAVVMRGSDRYPVALQNINRTRYLLISSNRGVGVGITLDEAIRAARDVAGLCKYVDRKRFEEQANAEAQ